MSGEDGPRLTFFAYLMVRIYGVTEEHYTKLEKKVGNFLKNQLLPLLQIFMKPSTMLPGRTGISHGWPRNSIC